MFSGLFVREMLRKPVYTAKYTTLEIAVRLHGSTSTALIIESIVMLSCEDEQRPEEYKKDI